MIKSKLGENDVRFVNAIQSIDNQFVLPFDVKSWIEYARAISSRLPEKCIIDSSAYSFNEDVLPVVSDALNNKYRLKKLSDLFDTLTNELKDRLYILFEQIPDVSIILYLGLCNGAGWATELDGKDAVLLGAEKILELKWDTEEQMRALIYHEIGHIWHKYEGSGDFEDESPKEAAIRWVFREGIAMVCEQTLCDDEHYYHQGAEWVNWCRKNLCEIKREYLRRIDCEESVQDFFGDWSSFMGHPDVGYYLGTQFIRYLLGRYTLKEAASLSCERLLSEFECFVGV